MNCTLTLKQQRLLFGKVAIDLKNIASFDFNTYAKDFFDIVNNKTKDPVLAANYVALLPMNIRAASGVSRDLYRKLASSASQIADLESQFENFDNVQSFVDGFRTEVQDIVNLSNTIQKESLTELPEPMVFPISEIKHSISLWDLNFDVDKEGELKPEMALYTNVKQQLIANKKDDGTSEVEGTPVKLQVVSMSDWPANYFYPNIQEYILAGDQRIINFNKKGVALLVTDLQGNPIYFDNEGKVSSEGKPVYYIFRAPKKVEVGSYVLDFNEKLYVNQLQRLRGFTEQQAEALLTKQNEVFKNIRETIINNPSTKIDMWITGGFSNIVLKPTPQNLTIGNVFDFQGKAFIPYKGIEGKENIYFFDYPGTQAKFTINKPKVPDTIITKLVQLLSENVVNRNGTPYRTTDKIALFKQFVYIDPAIIFLKENAQGELEVQKLGKTIVYPNKESMAVDLMNVFRNNILTRELNSTQVANKQKNGSKLVTEIKGAPYGSIYTYKDEDKVRYFEVGPLQLKVDKIAADTNKFRDFTLTAKDDKFTISVKELPYYPFIQENFLVDKNQIPEQKKEVGQTLEFSLAPQAALNIIKKEAVGKQEGMFDDEGNMRPEVFAKKTNDKTSGINEGIIQPVIITKNNQKNIKNELQNILSGNGQVRSGTNIQTISNYIRGGTGPVSSAKRTKQIGEEEEKPITPKEWLLSQKKLFKGKSQEQIEATLNQIDEAEKWYSNSPLNKYFSFETLFDVINKESSNNIAQWTTSGITLFKGADYSDLYHEAWHGFTQGFLNKEEKTNLYNEAKKLSGTFKDYQGTTVKFKDATDLQIEEYLAEDFREYMLSDGKKVLKTSPTRNTIFRRILDFLKELFGTATIKQTVIDGKVNIKVSDLYNKLRVGDLSSYTFAAENRNYDTLNKALQSINPNEVEKSLSFENSNIIYNAVNSLFSEAVDSLNQINLERIQLARDLQSKENKTPEEVQELEGLQTQITSSYTTAMTSTAQGIKTLYGYAKFQLEQKLAQLLEVPAPNVDEQKQIDLLEYALRNFGDIDKLYENKVDEGVIGYHIHKSDLVGEEALDEIAEQEELDARETEGKNYFDRGGNEKSPFETAAKEINNILKSLHQTDANGVVQTDIFGFPKLLNYKAAFAHILRITENSKDLTEMVSRLKKEQNAYTPIKQFLDKMGSLFSENQSDRETNLWSKFFQTFNKYRQPLVQTTVNKTVERNGQGEIIKTSYDIKIGNALTDTNRVDQDWRAQFAKENENPYIKNELGKGNYLDADSLLKNYDSLEKVNGNPMQFLKDVGIKLTDLPAVKNELESQIKSGTIRLSGIYNNIKKLNEGGVIIRNIGTYLTANPRLQIKGLVGQTGPNSNYGKLLNIQAKYSSDYSDFMVQNAAGDPQSEYTQNSSLTQIVKQINAANSYVELVNNTSTSNYNNVKGSAGRPYNPFINSSIWFNALFDMNGSGGSKRGNELIIDNLSGINNAVNDVFKEGVALSQADEMGKLLSDFHTQLMKFTPELTRHAGKKTSLAVYMRNYYTGAKNKRLYIDTESFIGDELGSLGLDNFQRILTKYIGAELDRINYSKELLLDESVQETDFKYLNRGTKFVAFSGVLSDKTKEQLYLVKGDLKTFLESDQGIGLENAINNDIISYFNKLVGGVKDRVEAGFVSPTLIERTREDARKNGISDLFLTDSNIVKALSSSFVANNWIQHFEEMITLYGDIALYKDFFKRNASLNSTGDIIRNDEAYIKTVNERIGKGFTEQLGISMEERPYTGQYNAAIVADVLVKSAYLDKYKEISKSNTIEEKYGENGVNEADAQGLIAFDTYRIILKSLGKWSNIQEGIYQDLLKGKSAEDIKTAETFPTLKMGYYGPLLSSYLPMTALHKFALFPLIPGVIPENLQELHEKMMRENIDYLTFESGSKVATIAKPEIEDGKIVGNKVEPFYSDIKTRTLSKEPFVKNTVFSEYLKYQVENAPYFKGKITLATQLRKLVDIGLTEEGVSTDFISDGKEKDRETAWEKLNEAQKKLASKNYSLRADYLKSLKDLVEAQKDKLLQDINWKENKEGVVSGDISSLLKLISTELERGDVGEHEWMYIQTMNGNDIKNDLDISTSVDVIEKVLTSLINKRLINLKVNGEQLVLVSTTGFEDKAFINQGDRNFEKPTEEDLLRYGTNDLPSYHIGKNGLIRAAKVKVALQGDFKKLLKHKDVKTKAEQLNITPFQALNLLIKDEEWLTEDENWKLISMVGARIPTQGINSAEFVEVFEFLPEIAGNIIIAPSEITSKGGSDFDFDKLPLMLPNLSIVNGNVVLDKEGVKGIENRLQNSLINILKQPSNFEALITPNDTNLVKPLADEIYEEENGKEAKALDKEGTRMFEPLHNIKIQQANSIGKDTLGIGAIYNTFNAVFNSIGLTLNSQFGNSKNPMRAKLMFPHNTKNGNISLSGLKDAEDTNSISEVVSQLINGWVDVEKDDWISYIQGNKEIAPVMLFMLRAGVPIKDVVYFVTQPLIKQYVEEQRILKGSFAEVLGRSFSQIQTPKKSARDKVLLDEANGFDDLPDTKNLTIYTKTLELVTKPFSLEELKNNPKKEITDLDRAVFLHFLEIENMSKEVDAVQRAFNVDTTTLLTLNKFYEKVKEIKALEGNTLISQKFIQRLKDNTPIGPFYVQEFALDIFKKVLPLRTNELLNERMVDLPTEVKSLFKDEETAMKAFKDDLLNYLFQKEVRDYEPTGEDRASVFSIPEVLNDAFTNTNERYHFINQRAKLEEQYPLNSISADIDYSELVRENYRKDELREVDQTAEQFMEKIEKISYQEWLNEKALYTILNPYQLFKSRTGIAGKYSFIVNKYPKLKERFSLLANIKTSYKEGLNNLQLSTMKLNKDEINVFYENFKDLGNSKKLVELGLEQRDADYVSDFFSKLPLYLYMQTGSNSRSPFSFNRIMPNEKILRILAKPVQDLTVNLDEKFLDEYTEAFTIANSNTTTRSRFKDYLMPDFEEVNDGVNDDTSDGVNTEIEEKSIEDVKIGSEIKNELPIEPKIVSDEDLDNLINQCK